MGRQCNRLWLLVLIFAAATSTASCKYDQSLLLAIEGIPSQAQSLQILVTYQDADSQRETAAQNDPELYALPQPTPSKVTLRIDFPVSISGRLSIGAATFTGTSIDSCINRTGAITYDISKNPLHQNAQLTLDKEVKDDTCSGPLPRIFSFTPGSAGTMSPLPITVSGWGFKPGAVVSFGGAAAKSTERTSASELVAVSPTVDRAAVVPLTVRYGDGSSKAQEDFRFYFSSVQFVPFLQLASSVSINGVILEKLDPNNALDFVTTLPDVGEVSVTILPGASGTGTETSYIVGAKSANAALADVDRDGDLDLISAASTTNQVVIFPNQGQGVFGTARRLSCGIGPSAVAAADLNQDGYADIVTADEGGPGLSVILSDGQGNYLPARTTQLFNTANPYLLGLIDMNGDGVPDIHVADRVQPRLSLFTHSGDGRISSNDNGGAVLATVDGVITELRVGDLNGDGHPDLVASMAGQSKLLVRYSGKLTDFQQRLVPLSRPARATATGDFDQDGRVDLLAGSEDNLHLEVLLQKSDGSFAPTSSFDILAGAGTVNQLALGDFTSDGQTDVFIAGSRGTWVYSGRFQ